MKNATNKRRWKPAILVAGIVAALFCSAAVATLMYWGVSQENTIGESTGVIALLRNGGTNRGAGDQRGMHLALAVARPTTQCAGCGVIESILVVDMRDETTGVCAVGDWVDHGLSDNASMEARDRSPATLAWIIADVVVGHARAEKIQSVARYELTIRFRDGARSKIKFASEPRWKPGDRVLVINNQT